MLTAEKAFSVVQEQAEKIKNDETAKIGTVSLGDVVRQGDLYLIAIGQLPKNRKVIKEMQLAPGTTQGSRHVADANCTIFDADKDEVTKLIESAVKPAKIELHAELIGPVIETTGECEIQHPEHGNRVLPSGEVFAVIYQRAFADTVRRQLD